MAQSNLIICALVASIFICLIISNTTASSETDFDQQIIPYEDLIDLLSEVDDSEEDPMKRLIPRNKLHRVFVGKRDQDLNELGSVEFLDEQKRGHPRRHLFIGKRIGYKNKKSGKIHRIFIG